MNKHVLMMRLFARFNSLYKSNFKLYQKLYYFYKNVSDRTLIGILKEYIQPGMYIVDIGANIGFYTEILAKLTGQSGHVFAFEPHPDNFEKLAAKLQVLKNVTLIQGAVGESNDKIQLYVSDDLNVDHRVYDTGSRRSQLTVDTYSLDSYLGEITKIDFIKMDIQGYEYFAIKGMRNLIASNASIRLLFEYFPAGMELAGTSPKELVSELHSSGFTLEVVGGKVDIQTVLNTQTGPEQYYDLLAYRI